MTSQNLGTTYIDYWEFPEPERCNSNSCHNLLREHWRRRPCLMNLENRVKYPHTMHFPWSPGLQNDDRVITDNQMEGHTVIVTEKMDGENTTMYCDGIHARSVMDMAPHSSRTWVKALHGQIAHLIPYGFRICGENLFAKHSIHYRNLKSYFQVFSIWDKDNNCLSWDDTEIFCSLLGLKMVPILAQTIYDEGYLKWLGELITNNSSFMEGYVCRVAHSFPMNKFENYMAKYVRKGHVQTSEHWLNELMIRNELIEE